PHLLGGAGVLALHGGAAQQAAVEQGGDGLGLLPQHRAGLHRPLGHQVVEVLTGDDVAEAGVVGVRRPLHLERAAEGEGPQAVEAVELRELGGQPDVVQLLDGAGGEAVAAGLLPRVVLLLEEEHVVAGLGQPVGARRPRRPAADDEDVVRGHQSFSRSYWTTAAIWASLSWLPKAGMAPTCTWRWPPGRLGSP